jgi:hypothetical protein
MITHEEEKYYGYIGTLYQGVGEAIELGPWLGKSTVQIVRGLHRSPNFNGRKLHVFDDFVWRPSWMNQCVSEDMRLPEHADFRFLFDRFSHEASPDIIVSRAKIADYDGNESRTQIRWDGRPIEVMYIDCGRTLIANEGWLNIFSKDFIPNVTLLIMQDWRTHRERPATFLQRDADIHERSS